MTQISRERRAELRGRIEPGTSSRITTGTDPTRAEINRLCDYADERDEAVALIRQFADEGCARDGSVDNVDRSCPNYEWADDERMCYACRARTFLDGQKLGGGYGDALLRRVGGESNE